jgi:hypothetical protein
MEWDGDMKWDGVWLVKSPRQVARDNAIAIKAVEPVLYRLLGSLKHSIGANLWPPKQKVGLSILKRIDAFLKKGKLVWLRDFDDVQFLSVAFTGSNGLRYAYRIWPHYHLVILNDDGTVSPQKDDNEYEYVRHWIWANETDKIYMFMQNSEKYSEDFDV